MVPLTAHELQWLVIMAVLHRRPSSPMALPALIADLDRFIVR